jgi:hypothetical protein
MSWIRASEPRLARIIVVRRRRPGRSISRIGGRSTPSSGTKRSSAASRVTSPMLCRRSSRSDGAPIRRAPLRRCRAPLP